jgi:threonyl-tRNA synthetase
MGIRLLLIHADNISYKITKKTKMAETIEAKNDGMEDCLVVFSCVEKLDEINPENVVDAAKKGIIDVMSKLKESKIMIFPFAHLSSTLGSPEVALLILHALENSLKNEGFEVKRAPFGWNKEFDLKSKGHPMAVLSKIICPYGKTECDFLCPYCTNPIKLHDVEGLQKSLYSLEEL